MNKNIKAVSALALGAAISINTVTPMLATATETKSTTKSTNNINNNYKNKINNIKVTTSINKSMENSHTNSNNGTTVTIPDTNLNNALKKELGKQNDDPITTDDMAKLQTLDISRNDITDLTGLETAINLEKLNISGNAIKDFKPISKLTKLNTLISQSTGLKDLSVLEGLTSLEYLLIGMNPITDTSSLSKLTNLKGIELESTRITSVPDISKLTKLEHLILNSTKITDISSIKGSGIIELGLSNLDIKDYTPIKNSEIQILHLDNAKNFDISIVNSLEYLTSISLEGIGSSKIKTVIDTLKNRPHLHELSLINNGITETSYILTLPQLNKTSTGNKFNLILDENYISDFSDFKSKPNVILSAQYQTLKLSSTNIKSDTLEIKPNLKSFDGNNIRVFKLITDGLVSPESASVQGTTDSILVKGLKPGVNEIRITYEIDDSKNTKNIISGEITQRVVVSDGLDLIVTEERSGVNNNGVMVFIKPAYKDHNIGSIETSQGDKLPASGGVIEVKENKDITITAIDKTDASKKHEQKISIVSIDKSGPTIDLASNKNTEGKTEITITAKNEAKGLSRIVLPSEKEVECKNSIFESKEVVENDGIYKVSAIDRAKTRLNKFIHVSDVDANAKLTITPNKVDATNENVTLTVAIKSGASDVNKVTLPDGSVMQGDSATFEVSTNGEYSFALDLSDGSTAIQKFTVQNIDKETPTAEVSKILAPDGSKRYIVNISAQDSISSVKSITVNGNTVNQTATKILTDQTDSINYTVTDIFDNTKEYTIDLDKFPTYSEIAESVIDSNIWVPIMNSSRSESVLYLDFSILEGIKSIKLPSGKTTTDTVFEYICTENGEHKFEIAFVDGSIFSKEVKIEGLNTDTIASNPGNGGTTTPDTDKPESDKPESDNNKGENNSNNDTTVNGSNSDKANPQTGDEGIKGYVIGFVSLITIAIGGILVQRKIKKNEDINDINEDINE